MVVGILAVAALQRWGSAPPRTGPDGDGELGAALLELLEKETATRIEIVGTVSWRTHPGKCWDYTHRQVNPTPHPGMQLSIYDCVEKPDKFIVPVKGTGSIKIAGDERWCLDAPGGAQLQFWDCDKANQANVRFIPNKSGIGTYRLASKPNKCIDVPNHDPANGNRLQMWRCVDENDEDMHFSIHAPVDCKWASWDAWTNCSEVCGGGERTRQRTKSYGVVVRKSDSRESLFYPLKKLTRPHSGGKECEGESLDSQECNTHSCEQISVTFKVTEDKERRLQTQASRKA